MEDKLQLIASYFGADRVKFDESLATYTALGVGGPAHLFFIAFSTSELIKIFNMAHELNIPFFIFGTGSKIMISEKGFEGVVVKNRTSNLSIVGVKGKVSKAGLGIDEAIIEVDSGVSIKRLVEFLNHQGLDSTDLVDIPGSIGGNLFLNRSLQEKVQSTKVLEEGEVENIKVSELSLRKHIILSIIFKFKARM